MQQLNIEQKLDELLSIKFESQLIEYKESWRDEYLKWICGFATTQAGIT